MVQDKPYCTQHSLFENQIAITGPDKYGHEDWDRSIEATNWNYQDTTRCVTRRRCHGVAKVGRSCLESQPTPQRSVLNLGKKVGLSKTAGNKSTASTTRNNTHHVADIYLRTSGQPTGDSIDFFQHLQILSTTNQRRLATTSIADFRCPTRLRRPLQVCFQRKEGGGIDRCDHSQRDRGSGPFRQAARVPRMVFAKGEHPRGMGQDATG